MSALPDSPDQLLIERGTASPELVERVLRHIEEHRIQGRPSLQCFMVPADQPGDGGDRHQMIVCSLSPSTLRIGEERTIRLILPTEVELNHAGERHVLLSIRWSAKSGCATASIRSADIKKAFRVDGPQSLILTLEYDEGTFKVTSKARGL